MKTNFIKKSHPAVCGIGEREITVLKKNIDRTLAGLRKKGFYVIGKSLDKGPKTKVWFIRGGSL